MVKFLDRSSAATAAVVVAFHLQDDRAGRDAVGSGLPKIRRLPVLVSSSRQLADTPDY